MAASPPAAPTAGNDPHEWLEEVLGEKALAWVKARNADCITAVGDPSATESYRRILGILDSKDKIPAIGRIGNDGWYYNFWQDETHVQGIWRKTTLESFRSGEPEWHTVIDVDALPPPSCDTASTWVWHSYRLLDEGPGGAWDRALVRLSPGGSDADTTREFDLVAEKFIEPEAGGFALPKAAKTDISYRARDEVLIGTDFDGDGASLTDSGYPRVVKSWRRGTALSEAVTVFEGEQADIAASQYAYHDRGFLHEFQLRSVTFYTSKRWYRAPADLNTPAADEPAPFEPVPVPDDVSLGTFADAATIELRSEWCPPGRDEPFPAGSLLVAPMADVMKGDFSAAKALFVPTAAASLQSQSGTKDYLVLKVLEDVRTVLRFWRYDGGGGWTDVTAPSEAGGAVAVGEDVSASAIWPDADNSMWLWRDGYLVPDVLELANAEDGCAATEVLKSKPAMFDSSGLVVDQHFATSLDGTKVPYFVLHREDTALDGSNATLLDAYGGFEISMLPGYSAGVGAGWLERGGVKVIANIRGGGEYGPKWHQAALKEHRHKAYEDVEAVAADLIERKITSPPKLAVIGGSNGGLMVGNMITRPVASRLFGAAVCQVPLLDMKRYSHLLAGASWMAEYGDPDTDDWAFLRRHSPYQILRHDCLGLPGDDAEGGAAVPGGRAAAESAEERWTCPKVLFTTSTRDDRVHPGHARKMVCALTEEAPPTAAPRVLYWENTEGGHGGAADNKQRAHMWSLTYEFLVQALGLGDAARL